MPGRRKAAIGGLACLQSRPRKRFETATGELEKLAYSTQEEITQRSLTQR